VAIKHPHPFALWDADLKFRALKAQPI